MFVTVHPASINDDGREEQREKRAFHLLCFSRGPRLLKTESQATL